MIIIIFIFVYCFSLPMSFTKLKTYLFSFQCDQVGIEEQICFFFFFF